MNVIVMISYIHIYVCLYEMCFDKQFHAVRVSRFGSPSGRPRGRDTPALRNHENLSYGGGMQQGLRSTKNFHNYVPPGFQGQQQGVQRADNQGKGDFNPLKIKC